MFGDRQICEIPIQWYRQIHRQIPAVALIGLKNPIADGYPHGTPSKSRINPIKCQQNSLNPMKITF